MAMISSTSSTTPAVWTPATPTGMLLPPQPVVDSVVDTVVLTGSTLASGWTPPPANFGLSGQGSISPLVSKPPVNTLTWTPNGVTGVTSNDYSLLRAQGSARVQAGVGPVALDRGVSGSVDIGRFTQEGSGSVQVGPGGLVAEGSFNQRLAVIDAKGKVDGSATLQTPFGEVKGSGALEGQYFVGSRTQIGAGGIGLPGVAPGLAPGDDPGKATLNLGPNGNSVNAGFSHFTGAEAQATLRTGLDTPVGSFSQATTARAAIGAAATGGVQYQSTPTSFAAGLGGSFEYGPQAGLRQETAFKTPDGSVLNITTAAGVGGPSGEASLGFARDNATGTTTLGGTLIVPIEGLVAGGGVQASIKDSTLEAGARGLGYAAGGPLAGKPLGEAAASTVKPVMDTIPVVAPVVGEALVNASPIGAAYQAGKVVAENPGVVVEAASVLTNPIGTLYRWASK